ncbi:tRNA1(Val) (adenine(37)-N6)-methyltransferase [Algicella marina]|uniref:Methyltransferase n=1 Tax=Algicella marina TaxID=2683284 RepID=A0A6P1T266_9RHOB|nr:methyltransferase [Algicella marina]QHQ37024.1 methyltransferase [Algicella marina]
MSNSPPDQLTEDAFLGGRLRILQPRTGYRAATDPVLLAAALDARAGQHVLDLGCGVGTAALAALSRIAGLAATGVELQHEYATLARRNAEMNALALHVATADIRALPSALVQRSFDHVLINPPFYAAETATAPQDEGRDTAHREGEATLADFLDCGLRRLAPGGSITVIHRTERLADILAGLSSRTGGIRIKPLAAREGRAAGRVLVSARKGARAPLTLLAPLVIHEGAAHGSDGASYSQAVEAILRHGKSLIW